MGPPNIHPYAFASDAAALVSQMTLDEKVAFCSGDTFWNTAGCARLGLKPVAVSDGPIGLRKQAEGSDHLGLGAAVPATCFPSGVNLGSSWDTSLVQEMASHVARECRAKDVTVVLGPAINMKRSPLCGRNFEYFSEDPFLAGELAAAYVAGCQSQDVGTSVKHFAANNQEFGRMRIDTRVDERTLRELYLPAFERAVVSEQPWTIMAAYNQINGAFCTENEWLLSKVLREEWAFQGLVVSDWGGCKDRVAGISRGNDLEMPSSGGFNDRKLAAAVRAGELDEATLDVAVIRVVSLLLAAKSARRTHPPAEEDEAALFATHHDFARRAACESAVLLKNDGGLLPLRPSAYAGRASPRRGGHLMTIAVCGRMATAEATRFQGAGSSLINAHRIDEPLAAINELVLATNNGAGVEYSPGYGVDARNDDPQALDDAAALAARSDAAVVFVGLPAGFEVEGVDRAHMRIPEVMNELISRVRLANKNTIVVVLGGAPMELPTCADVPSILYMGLGGQAVGGAVAELLFGAAAPTGKLAETWPLALDDCPCQSNFAAAGDATIRQVVYREGLNVGYRYFSTANVPVAYPFGHGLTYTTFGYSELVLSKKAMSASESVRVTLRVTNSGRVSSSEVVQLYVRDVEASVPRPDRELKAFAKVRLAPGKSEDVSFTLDPRAFAFYDTRYHDWYVEGGDFELLVGASCADIRLSTKLRVTNPKQRPMGTAAPVGTPRPKEMATRLLDDAALDELGLKVPPETPLRPVTAQSTFEEIRKASAFGWCLVGVMVMGAKRTATSGAAAGLGEGDAAVQIVVGGLLGSTFQSLQLMTGGVMPTWSIDVLVHLINGRLLSALARLFGGCKLS